MFPGVTFYVIKCVVKEGSTIEKCGTVFLGFVEFCCCFGGFDWVSVLFFLYFKLLTLHLHTNSGPALHRGQLLTAP